MLSSFVFNDIFMPAFKCSQELQVIETNGEFVAWPVGRTIDQTKNNQIHKFSRKTRCLCPQHIKWLSQCSAELRQFRFDKDLWCDRWYNYSNYRNINDLNCVTTAPNNDSSNDTYDHEEDDDHSDHSVKSSNECVFVI